MRVILLERVAKLGQMGDVVNVKAGYARNFLLPTNKAAPATQEHIDSFNQKRTQLEAHNLETKNEALKLLEKIENIKPVIIAQASETKQLYGSVKARDIVAAVHEQGLSLSHKQVALLPIKVLGLHSIDIKLHPEVVTSILVCIASNDEEANLFWETGVISNELNQAQTSSPDVYPEPSPYPVQNNETTEEVREEQPQPLVQDQSLDPSQEEQPEV